MQCISCCFNHFRVIEVLDAQKNRHLKTSQSAIELKRDANLSVLLASPGSLDACYLDPKFVHLTTMARFATLLEKQTRKFLAQVLEILLELHSLLMTKLRAAAAVKMRINLPSSDWHIQNRAGTNRSILVRQAEPL
jgi:hypothetical protein